MAPLVAVKPISSTTSLEVRLDRLADILAGFLVEVLAQLFQHFEGSKTGDIHPQEGILLAQLCELMNLCNFLFENGVEPIGDRLDGGRVAVGRCNQGSWRASDDGASTGPWSALSRCL